MNRSILRILFGFLNKNNWLALLNSFYIYKNWYSDYLLRYVLGFGSYPKEIFLRTPMGLLNITANCHEDLFTVNEIFGMECYKSQVSLESFIDFGGNIGLSAAYFLTRNTKCKGVVYEPLDSNFTRLKQNLYRFRSRISCIKKAIWIDNGEVNFGVDKTGRYSGINLVHDTVIKINPIDVNKAIADGIRSFGRISVLKIDIEGAGLQILQNLNVQFYNSIECIMIEESPFSDSFLIDLGYKKLIFDSNGLFHYIKK